MTTEYEETKSIRETDVKPDGDWIIDHGILVKRSKHGFPVYHRAPLNGRVSQVLMLETASCDIGSPQYERGELENQNSGLQSLFMAIDSEAPTTLIIRQTQEDLRERDVRIVRTMVDHYLRMGFPLPEIGVAFVEKMKDPPAEVIADMESSDVVPFTITPAVAGALAAEDGFLELRLLLNDKVNFARLCEQRGILIPRYLEDVATSPELVRSYLGDVVMLKPRSRSGGDGIYRTEAKDIQNRLAILEAEGYCRQDLYLQEAIGLDPESFGTILWVPPFGSGDPEILQTSRQLYGQIGSEENWDGITYYGSEWRREYQEMPNLYNQRVVQMARATQELGYVGQIGFDMRDLGNPRVVDTSPRWTGQLPLLVFRQKIEEMDVRVDEVLFTAGLKAPKDLTEPDSQNWLSMHEFTPENGRGIIMLKPVPGSEAIVSINLNPTEVVSILKERYE